METDTIRNALLELKLHQSIKKLTVGQKIISIVKDVIIIIRHYGFPLQLHWGNCFGFMASNITILVNFDQLHLPFFGENTKINKPHWTADN